MFSTHLISSMPGSRPLCSCCPCPTPTHRPLPILYHRAITAHLFVTTSANEGQAHGEQAPMRPLFHLYKTFQDGLLGCTFWQSRAPRGEQQPRERGGRESKCERRGGRQHFNPNPTLQESGGWTYLLVFFYVSDQFGRSDWCDCVFPICPEASLFQWGWRTHTSRSRRTFCHTSA